MPAPSSRRPASTTRRSSARASCGRCTRRSCATRPGSASSANSSPSASGGPSTAAATPTCSSSAAGSPAGPPPPRPRARGPTSCSSTRVWPGLTEPLDGVELIAGGSALGSFDGLVPVWQGDTLHQIRAARLVFATGTIEQPLVFAGNDLPGVMLTGGALRLAQNYAVAPGRRAVIATTTDRGLVAAQALRGGRGRDRRGLRPAARGQRARSRAAPRRGAGVRRAHGDRGARAQGRADGGDRRAEPRLRRSTSTSSTATWC